MAERSICVIGGGPAGLAAALEGAKLGLRVDLLCRNRIGDHIRCAEGFYDSLQLLGEPRAGVRFKVREAVLKVNREYLVDCRRIRLWMIDRREWQLALAQQARNNGVRLCENTRVTVADLEGLQREYSCVIDATGAPSLTSLKYGFRNYYLRNGAVTAQYVIEGDFSRLGERLKFVLFPNYQGYYWIFPRGRDAAGRQSANVGIGFFSEKVADKLTGDYLWKRLEKALASEQIDGRVLRRHGGVAPVVLRKDLVYGNLLLVGDAAGCASPLHGGGIDTAYLSGRLAARCIASGEDYSRELWRLLGPKLEVEKRLCAIWDRLDRESLDDLAGLLSGNPIGTARCLLRHFGLLAANLRIGLRFRSGLYHGRW